MQALAHAHDPERKTAERRLRPVPDTRPRTRRRPHSGEVARYALGLTISFVLAAIASSPGGTGPVVLQVVSAAVAACIALGAALRERAVVASAERSGM